MKTKDFFARNTVLIVLVIWQIVFVIIAFNLKLHNLWREDEANLTTPDTNERALRDQAKVLSSSYNITPELPKDTFVLIAIITVPSKFERRETLRGTWAKNTALSNTGHASSSKPHDKMTMAYFFTFGFEGNPSVDMNIEGEASTHKDILRVNLMESYRGLVSKILLTFEWITRLDIKPSFIVKADDDVYVKMPDLAKWLHKIQPSAKIYAGFVHSGGKTRVHRSPENRWYVSSEQYNKSHFPPYCAGPFYMFSRNVFLEIVNASKIVTAFPVEDSYIGVLASKIGVKPQKTGRDLFYCRNFRFNGWILKTELKNKTVPSGIVLGHLLSSKAIQLLHRAYWIFSGP